MDDLTTIIVILIFLFWVFRPNSGNNHLQQREQEIEELARDIMERNANITYPEAYQEAIEILNARNKK